MSTTESPVVHVDELEEISRVIGEWGAHYKVLTPSMRPRGGSLGINLMRVPPGHAAVPFHTHEREDEVFYVLGGRGVLRYGEQLYEVCAGHCISCPAGTGIAHQIANPFDDDLVYLAIGPYDPHEVCRYPDSGKVMVRALDQVGRLTETPYLDGEPDRPRILDLWAGR